MKLRSPFALSPLWKTMLWLGLLTLPLYINVLRNGFVWDDKIFIADNYSIRHPHLVFSLQSRLPLGNRPLMALSLAFDFLAWGLNPAGFHLTNLLLHLLNVWLVYFLAVQLRGGKSFAPLAALLFAFHPVHSEAVAAMLGRSDLLIAALLLLSLLAYRRFLGDPRPLRRWAFYVLTLFGYGAAGLTKESGLILPLLLVLCENGAWGGMDRPRRSWKAQAASLLPFLFLAVLSLLFRQRTAANVEQPAWGGGLWQTMLLMLVVVWKYLILLVFPAFLSPYYIIYWPVGLDWFCVVGGFVFLAGGVCLMLRFWRRSPLLAWAVAWIGVTLLPFSNVIPIPGAMMNERWLYLPSVSFCILLAWGIHGLLARSRPELRNLLLGLGGVILVFAALRIVTWNSVWRDTGTVSRAILSRHPDSKLAHNNLGNSYIAAGRFREAREEYAQSFRLDPTVPEVVANLGLLFWAEGDSARGLAFTRRAVALDPQGVPSLFTLGLFYHRLGKRDSALVYYQRVLKLNPLHLLALSDAGLICMENKDWKAAEEYFSRAVVIAPRDSLVTANLRKLKELRSSRGS